LLERTVSTQMRNGSDFQLTALADRLSGFIARQEPSFKRGHRNPYTVDSPWSEKTIARKDFLPFKDCTHTKVRCVCFISASQIPALTHYSVKPKTTALYRPASEASDL